MRALAQQLRCASARCIAQASARAEAADLARRVVDVEAALAEARERAAAATAVGGAVSSAEVDDLRSRVASLQAALEERQSVRARAVHGVTTSRDVQTIAHLESTVHLECVERTNLLIELNECVAPHGRAA